MMVMSIISLILTILVLCIVCLLLFGLCSGWEIVDGDTWVALVAYSITFALMLMITAFMPFKTVGVEEETPISVIRTDKLTVVIYNEDKVFTGDTTEYYNATNIVIKKEIQENIFGKSISPWYKVCVKEEKGVK